MKIILFLVMIITAGISQSLADVAKYAPIIGAEPPMVVSAKKQSPIIGAEPPMGSYTYSYGDYNSSEYEHSYTPPSYVNLSGKSLAISPARPTVNKWQLNDREKAILFMGFGIGFLVSSLGMAVGLIIFSRPKSARCGALGNDDM